MHIDTCPFCLNDDLNVEDDDSLCCGLCGAFKGADEANWTPGDDFYFHEEARVGCGDQREAHRTSRASGEGPVD